MLSAGWGRRAVLSDQGRESGEFVLGCSQISVYLCQFCGGLTVPGVKLVVHEALLQVHHFVHLAAQGMNLSFSLYFFLHSCQIPLNLLLVSFYFHQMVDNTARM